MVELLSGVLGAVCDLPVAPLQSHHRHDVGHKYLDVWPVILPSIAATCMLRPVDRVKA